MDRDFLLNAVIDINGVVVHELTTVASSKFTKHSKANRLQTKPQHIIVLFDDDEVKPD